MTLSNVRSSLPLEILLHVNARYSVLFYAIAIGLYAYKLTLLDYPLHVEVSECIVIALFAPIEALRIKWAHRGNLTETPVYVTFSLLLSAAVASICVYVGLLQSYVFIVERIGAGTQLIFLGIEAVFEIAAIASFSRSSVSTTTIR